MNTTATPLPDLSLREFLRRAGRRSTLRLAAALEVSPVVVTQWSREVEPKAVPEARAQHIEWISGFTVRVETLCPGSRWVRIPDSQWPHGRPLLDHMPAEPARQIELEPQPETAA
jgi:hypothetical protein